MNLEQFNALKIGDSVYRSEGQDTVTVSDIDRRNMRIHTGGAWRYYKTVRVPVPETATPTPTEPHPEEMTFPLAMLRTYGLTATSIILAVRRAGPEGFVGSLETLCNNTHICTFSTCRHILSSLIQSRVLKKTEYGKQLFRLIEINQNS